MSAGSSARAVSHLNAKVLCSAGACAIVCSAVPAANAALAAASGTCFVGCSRRDLFLMLRWCVVVATCRNLRTNATRAGSRDAGTLSIPGAKLIVIHGIIPEILRAPYPTPMGGLVPQDGRA